MEDEFNFEEEEQPKINRPDQRVKNLLAEKEQLNTEKEELSQAKLVSDAEAESAKKELEFYKDFSAQTSKYSGATEFQDQIKEKVLSGYSVEDATVSVLAKEGKLPNMQEQAPVEASSPAGGSAVTTMTGGADKSIGEMSKEEKRAKLVELESRGDISLS